jgi:hypothetical protein
VAAGSMAQLITLFTIASMDCISDYILLFGTGSLVPNHFAMNRNLLMFLTEININDCGQNCMNLGVLL